MTASHDDLVLVTGAGGFIGGHLVGRLLAEGYRRVRAVDIKPADAWFQLHSRAENKSLDLRLKESCLRATQGVREIYHLAANMGGMGFIETHKAECMLSVLIDTHLLLAAREHRCDRVFYASTACVYAAGKQDRADLPPLREGDAYPAEPEDGYGWQKLFGERLCRHFNEDFGVTTRVARFHAIHGEHGTFEGGREKAPAAICRKVAEAKLTGKKTIEIWGDGQQTRSFLYIDEAIEGTRLLMDSSVEEPLNLGSTEMVTIDRLVDMVEEIAGVRLERHYDTRAPQGVRGRCSDNTRIRQELGWAPSLSLQVGLERTYRWVYNQVASRESV
jgi:nucleoside-diphosphate-sugar epimerase